MATIAIDILFENLEQLMNCDLPLTLVEKDEIKYLYEELAFLRSFVKEAEEKQYAHSEVKDLVTRIRDVAYEAEVLIDWLQVRVTPLKERQSIDIFGPKTMMLYSCILFLICSWKLIGRVTPLKGRESMGIAAIIGHMIMSRFIFQKSWELLGRSTFSALKPIRFFHLLLPSAWKFDLSANLYGVKKEIKSIRAELLKIYDDEFNGIGVPQDGNSYGGGSSSANTPASSEEVVVGFDDQAVKITEILAGNQSRLEVLSIVGMAGSGKTTLASKVYNNPYIAYHFHVRAWTYVSQLYQKKAVLLGILRCVVGDTDEIEKNWSAEMMQEKVYKCLKGRRYLIVLDDVWDFTAWDDLNKCFPNDNNGSRILFTTRHMEMALYPNHRRIHHMGFLNENESWSLMKRKVFGEEKCSPELVAIGKQIAEKCGGLPLPIVVLAGILAREMTQDWWKKVAGSVSSFIVSEKHIMETLALSYNHLPYFLKPCFLYFGLFRQNYEIPVKKLIMLWVAEGFIKKTGGKCLEDVAKDYLTDLMDRSLVLPAQRASNGGIKACRLHDLLHDLCLRKSEEENFLQKIYPDASSSSPIYGKQRRLGFFSKRFYISSMPSTLHLRSFLCFSCEIVCLFPGQINSFICQALELVTVLDLFSIRMSSFPTQIVKLVLLRYLALYTMDGSLPRSVSNLQNLETLVLSQVEVIPSNIWKMVKLRHLIVTEGENDIENFLKAEAGDGCPSILNNLQTISQVSLSPNLYGVLSRTPNLRKLGICGSDGTAFPNLHFLNHLETLRLTLFPPHRGLFNLGNVQLPHNLKKLILSFTEIGWNQLSTIGMLPNLEVLKLLFHGCLGPKWETSDGGFLRLKFLKLSYVHLAQWSTESSHFPSLERLQLFRCEKLVEIPSELRYIPTLQMIEVIECSHLASNSARQMKEEQHEMGNDQLKICITDLEPATDSDSDSDSDY